MDGQPVSASDRGAAIRAGEWIIVALAAVAVHLNALPNGFTYDDVPIILENPATDPAASWWEPWRHPYWPGSSRGDDLDVLYRPLTVQTYAIQRRLFGAWPLPFHLVNVILHAAVSVGVVWLARRLGCRPIVAAAVGLVFAVHPIHVEAVANVVGRAELLSTGGILLALWMTDRWCDLTNGGRARHRHPSPTHRCAMNGAPACAMNGAPANTGESPVPHRHRSTCMAWAGILLAAFVAMTSKEGGVGVIVFVAAWYGWRRWSSRENADVAKTGRAGWWIRGLAALLIPLVVLVAAYLVARYEVCGFRLSVGGQRVGPGNPLREADSLERVLTPVSLIGRYVVMMVCPARLLCDYSADVIRLTRTVTEGHFLAGMTFIAALVAGATVSIRRNLTGLLIAVGFAGAYFIASNTVLLIDITFAERIFYGPSVWVCVGVGVLIEDAFRRGWIGGPRRVTTTLIGTCCLAMLAGLGIRTLLRNPAWADNETLFRGDLAAMDSKRERKRRSAHLCYTVARLDAGHGDLASAESLLLEAISYHRDYPKYYHQLGQVYIEIGAYEAAVEALERAHLLEPRNLETVALLDRARQSAAGVDVDAKLAAARQAAHAQPDNVEALRDWATLAETVVDRREAVEAYRRLARLQPHDTSALKGLAFALAASGEIEEAAATFRLVLKRWPDEWEAHTNLALLLMDRTDAARYDPTSAQHHARLAVELNPTHWQARVNLAEVLAHCGDRREAARLFEQLAKQCPEGSDQRRLYLERARFLGGR